MPTEREKMLAGQLYDATDPDLIASRKRARTICRAMYDCPPEDADQLQELINQLIGRGGETAWIEPPFHCDYGSNITLGKKVYFNFNCIVLDVCHVEIGDHTLLGPAVQIYTASHPMDAQLRRSEEFGKPISIGSDVWIGGGAIICPGVTIGDRTVIGAGSVVTKDIPSGVFAAGNPCRVIREIESTPSE